MKRSTEINPLKDFFFSFFSEKFEKCNGKMKSTYPIKHKIMAVSIILFSIGIILDLAAFGILFNYKKLPIEVHTVLYFCLWIRIICSIGIICLSITIFVAQRNDLILIVWIESCFLSGLVQILTLASQFSAGSSEHFEIEKTGHGIFFFLDLLIHIICYSFVSSNYKTIAKIFYKYWGKKL